MVPSQIVMLQSKMENLSPMVTNSPEAFFKYSSGVAEDTPSSGFVHPPVIKLENIRNKNKYPATAGLKMFFPNPPNIILITIIANNAPMGGSQSGVEAGRENASKTPVTMAEQSESVCLRFIDRL